MTPPSDPLDHLPHREPFLFVERVLELHEGVAVCEKTFPAADPVFRGHFPGEPIVPGVLLTEALAQTAGLAAANFVPPGGKFLLSAIRSMKFPRAVLPGTCIRLEAKKSGEMGGLLIFEVKASTKEGIAAEGSLVLNLVHGHPAF